MDKAALIAEITADMRAWWLGWPCPEEGLKQACVFWAGRAAEVLRRKGYKAQIHAGTANWNVVKGTDLTYGYKFTWNQTTFMEISTGILPEMHAWAAIMPEHCPEGRGQLIDMTGPYIRERARDEAGITDANIDYPVIWCYWDELYPGTEYKVSLQASELALSIYAAFRNRTPIAFRVLEDFYE